MSEQQKQAWRDYFHQLRQYQLNLNVYYYDLVDYISAAARDGDEGSNPPTPPTPPKPPGS